MEPIEVVATLSGTAVGEPIGKLNVDTIRAHRIRLEQLFDLDIDDRAAVYRCDVCARNSMDCGNGGWVLHERDDPVPTFVCNECKAHYVDAVPSERDERYRVVFAAYWYFASPRSPTIRANYKPTHRLPSYVEAMRSLSYHYGIGLKAQSSEPMDATQPFLVNIHTTRCRDAVPHFFDTARSNFGAPLHSTNCMDGERSMLCMVCYVPWKSNEFGQCGHCKMIRYCSRDCQRSDWKRHKGECALLTSVQIATTTATIDFLTTKKKKKKKKKSPSQNKKPSE